MSQAVIKGLCAACRGQRVINLVRPVNVNSKVAEPVKSVCMLDRAGS
jgi:hypothetical protein